jgi:glycosyltransferase involved in cell wall biosynthesis
MTSMATAASQSLRAGSVRRPRAGTRALAGLSIVLPCFNEVDNIGEAIRQAQRAARAVAGEHEIIVVDDGSDDGTGAVVAEAARRSSAVRLVSHAANEGYGAALRSGIEAARMPWIFLTDADLQFDLGQLAGLGPLTATADVIVGRRVNRRDPFHRRVNAAAWNRLVRLVFDVPLHDVDCAFKLVRAEMLQPLELRSTGATISTELVVKAIARGGRLAEVDVEHRARIAGRPSGARPHVVLRALRELVALRAAHPAYAMLRQCPERTPMA